MEFLTKDRVDYPDKFNNPETPKPSFYALELMLLRDKESQMSQMCF